MNSKLFLCILRDTGVYPEKQLTLVQIITKNPFEAAKIFFDYVSDILIDDLDIENKDRIMEEFPNQIKELNKILADYLSKNKLYNEMNEMNQMDHEYDVYCGEIVYKIDNPYGSSFILEFFQIKLDKKIFIPIFEH